VLSDDPSEAAHSTADIAVVTTLPGFCTTLAKLVSVRTPRSMLTPPLLPACPSVVDGLLAAHVFQALAERFPPDTVVVEESPSTRLELQQWVPARQPLGFLSAAMGGLGFALPAAAGLKMAQPDPPAVAVVGDGSSLYNVDPHAVSTIEALTAVTSSHRDADRRQPPCSES